VIKGLFGPRATLPLGPEGVKGGDKPKIEEGAKGGDKPKIEEGAKEGAKLKFEEEPKETIKFETEECFNCVNLNDPMPWLKGIRLFYDELKEIIKFETEERFNCVNLNDPTPWGKGPQIFYDAPDVWQFRFQDPASSSMEGILLFNKHILFVIKNLFWH